MKLYINKKHIFILAIISFLIFIVNLVSVTWKFESIRKKFTYDDSYYTRYKDFKLYGTVEKKYTLDNDRYSLYIIKPFKSNYKLHDLRDSNKNFFLTINRDSAFFVYSMSYDILVNDLVFIDYKQLTMNVFRNNKQMGFYSLPNFRGKDSIMQKRGLEILK